MLIHPNEIEKIPYPDEHREALKRIGPLLIEATKRDGLPFESGQFDLGRLEKGLRLPLFFFYWTAESNDVIANLNMILADLRELPKKYALMPGSSRGRFYLSVRTYFYEFYRLREIFNHATKELLVGGYLNKSEV